MKSIGFKGLGNHLWFVIAFCLFRVSLDYSYVVFVHPFFEYGGFNLEVVVFNYLMSWVFTFFLIFMCKPNLKNVSDFIVLIWSVTILLPLLSYYGLAAKEIYPVFVSLLSFTIFWLIVNFKGRHQVRVPRVKSGITIAYNMSLVFIMILIAWFFVSGAVRYFNLDLTKVYDYRELSFEATSKGIMAYVNGWVYNIFSVFAMTFALYKRNYLVLVLLVAVQVFFFGVSAHKSVLFLPLMILVIWRYFSSSNKLAIVPLGLTLLVIFCLGVWFWFDDPLVPSMFVRRVFFTPATLTYSYFEFFQMYPHVYWGNSVLSFLVDYQYNAGVSELIGIHRGTYSNANNGLVASGYAHAGLFGVILYSVILGAVVKLIESQSRHLPTWFSLCVTIVPIRNALSSSDLFTVLLTHGLILAIFLLYLSRSLESE